MAIIWDKDPDRTHLPLPVEALEPIEEDAAIEEEELVEEVKKASGFTFKGFGS